MKKRFLATFLCVCMVLTLLPAMSIPALAAAPAAPTSTTTWDFTAVDEGGSGTGWVWEHSSKTLTLTDFAYTTSAADALIVPDATTIVLNGTSTIASTYSGADASHGIQGLNLAINSSSGGKLTVTGGTSTDADSNGISGARVSINGNAIVIANGGAAVNSSGIQGAASIGIGNTANVTATGGAATGKSLGLNSTAVLFSETANVTATGGSAATESVGIFATTVEIQGAAEVTATGGVSGVSVAGTITISGAGTLIATGSTRALLNDYTVPVGYEYYVSTTTAPDTTKLISDGSFVVGATHLYAKIVAALANAATPTIVPLANKTVDIGVTTDLTTSATVTDGGTLTYQWYRNTTNSNTGGTSISGATSTTYAAPIAAFGTIYYYCVVTNTNSSVPGEKTATATSNAVAVQVAAGYSLYFKNGASGWNLYEGDTTTVYTGQPGKWSVSGNTLTLNGFEFETSDRYALSTSEAANITLTGDNIIKSVYVGNNASSGINARGDLTINGTGKLTVFSGNSTGSSSASYGTGIDASAYTLTIDGSVDVTAIGGNLTNHGIGIQANILTIRGGSLTGKGSFIPFIVDALVYYIVPNGYNYIVSDNIDGSDATTGIGDGMYYIDLVYKYVKIEAAAPETSIIDAAAPTIITQPVGKTVNVGGTAPLTIVVSATDIGDTLWHQWYSNTTNSTTGGTAIIGNSIRATYNAPTAEAGTVYYYCIVTNSNPFASATKTASVTSDVVAVTVTLPDGGTTTTAPPADGATGEITIPGGTVTLPEGSEPITDADGTVTLPDGGKIETPGGTVIDVPAGTTIAPDGKITIGSGGATITYPDGTSLSLPEGLEIMLDDDFPLGFFVVGMPFVDVLLTDWFYDDVLYVFMNGMFNGTSATTFSPQMPMTRGMIVTVLGRLAGINVADYSGNSFDDVNTTMYYAPYVKWAAEKGIVNGVGNNKFAPNADISRQDLAAILYRYAEAMEIPLPEITTATTFDDGANISDYAKEAVAAMQKAGIINGKPGNVFDPQGTATRAEVAAMLHRFCEAVN